MTFWKFLKNREGTALLVALLVMGVLIAISLALSGLILREILTTREILDAGRAYYAAESGIETALYKLNNNLPGWETENKDFVPLKLDEDYIAAAEYKVDNTCNAYPCFDEGFDKNSIGEGNLDAYYDVLELNESITIPLFVVDSDGSEQPVGDFTVEFFAPFNPTTDLQVNVEGSGLNLISGWDILRWKVFGINNRGITGSISDFTGLSILRNQVTGEDFSTTAAQPSWFGSISCNDGTDDRYADEIDCTGYVTQDFMVYNDPDQESKIIAGTCELTQAREYYDYVDEKLESEDIKVCYEIGDFLSSHNLNYLTLTNLMNPSVFSDDFDEIKRIAKSRLYFRVELFEDSTRAETSNQTVREFADITANGYSGDSKQSINVKIQRGSFMPVFNFSLYSTYKNEEIGHGRDYWIEEE